jgi:hypothetical protein
MTNQAAKHAARAKYAPNTLQKVEGRRLDRELKDPVLLKAFHLLQRDKDTAGFFQLYQYAVEGKLKGYETFTQICEVLTDQIRRNNSDNANAKYGVRYPANYLNFMVLLRSYGAKSARQYGILTSQIPGPSPRHLRYVFNFQIPSPVGFQDVNACSTFRALVANAEDSLQNPYLIPENLARVRRHMDRIGYSGPVSFGSDCTKVRKCLTFSTDFGSHILGSVLPMDECEVNENEDIDAVIGNIKEKKAEASQVRAIMVNVWPMIPLF